MNKIRVGIIGAGGIARGCHIPGWKNIKNVEITAIADIDMARAQSVAAEHNILHVFSDYRKLVEQDIDIVDVCTPNRVHTPAVLCALEHGKHVICEKPLAVSTAEVEKMGKTADAKKLKLMTAHHQRFTKSAQTIKQWIDAGNLGTPYHARVKAMRRAWLPIAPGFIDAKLSGGGPCMDIGVHALDLCMWLMGFPLPVRVTGVAKTIFAKGKTIPGLWGEWDRKLFSVEDFSAGFIHFSNGATMTLEASWLGHQQEVEELGCQIFGTKAGIKWPSGEFASVSGESFVQGTVGIPPRREEKPHWEELKAFYECVVSDKPSPVPWTETIKVIAILEGIYISEKKKREIKIKV